MERCAKHNIELECLAGRSAHGNNWYCPKCDEEEDNKSICDPAGSKLGSAQEPELAMRHNTGKSKLSYIFDAPFATAGKVRVKEQGALKYSRGNWQKGREWMDCLDSLLRHTMLYAIGEDRDDESGELHIDHIQANAEFLSEWFHTHPELDDRPRGMYTEEQIKVLKAILNGK